MSLWLLALAVSRPVLRSSTRDVLFASTPHRSGCDGDGSFLVYGVFSVEGSSEVVCEDGVLLVDGLPTPSARLTGTGKLGFYHAISDTYVVVHTDPVSSEPEERVGGATGSLIVGRKGDVRLHPTTAPPQVYAIRETVSMEWWYSLEVRMDIRGGLLHKHYRLLDPDTGESMVNASHVRVDPRYPLTFNVSFDRNWPDSGNGKHIAADLQIEDSPTGFNDRIEGIAYEYDAKACACHWNGTACTHRCSFNSPHLGWRGPAVRVSGELVTKAPPSELSAPGSLTSAQIKELYDVLELGLQLLSGGGTSQGGANLASTCDATTGRDFVLGIISTDAGSSGFDKFWGTSCTLSSEGQTTTTNWKLLAQDRFMLTLLWWLGLTPNRIDICDAVTPDRCSFCEVSEERVERCKKNDDGTDSYASQKALIDLFAEMGHKPVQRCDECIDGDTACEDTCIRAEIVDEVLHGPHAQNISTFLQNFAHATLGLTYVTINKGDGSKYPDGSWKQFGDRMWHTWDGDRTHPEVEGKHATRRYNLRDYHRYVLMKDPGFMTLTAIISRVTLKEQLSIYLKDHVPPSLQDNACLADDGHGGIALFSKDSGVNATAVAEAIHDFFAEHLENQLSLRDDCLRAERVQHMLDALAPGNTDFFTGIANELASVEMEKAASSVRLQDPGELAGFILKYMQTLYSYIEQCPASQNPQPACKAFANLPANVRQMMLDEYSELMLSYNITQRQDAVQELIWQIQVPVQRLAVDVSMGGATLSSILRALDQSALPRACFFTVIKAALSMFRFASAAVFLVDFTSPVVNVRWYDLSARERDLYMKLIVSFALEALVDVKYVSQTVGWTGGKLRQWFADVFRGVVPKGDARYNPAVSPRDAMLHTWPMELIALRGVTTKVRTPPLGPGPHDFPPQSHFVAHVAGDTFIGARILSSYFTDASTFRSSQYASFSNQVTAASSLSSSEIPSEMPDVPSTLGEMMRSVELPSLANAGAISLRARAGQVVADLAKKGVFDAAVSVLAIASAAVALQQDVSACAGQTSAYCTTLITADALETGAFALAALVTVGSTLENYGFYVFAGAIFECVQPLGLILSVVGALIDVVLAFVRKPPPPPSPPTEASIDASELLLVPFVDNVVPDRKSIPGWYSRLASAASDAAANATAPKAPPLPPAPPQPPQRPPPSPAPPDPPSPPPAPPHFPHPERLR